jgi:hypothetical protein
MACRGGFKTRPYVPIQHNDPMNMVWHEHKRVAFDTRIVTCQIIPHRLNHAPGIIQPYFSIHDLTKETGSIPRNGCNEIGSSLSIIIPLKRIDRRWGFSTPEFIDALYRRNKGFLQMTFFCGTVGAGLKPAPTSHAAIKATSANQLSRA